MGHHVSSVPSSMTRTPPGQQRIQQRSLTSDDMTRERVLQKPPRQEYLVPLPTPMPTPEDLVPHQRRLIPAEPRHAEPRSIEPRPGKGYEAESRAEARGEARGDTAPIDPYTESRKVDQRRGEPRQVEQRYVDSRPTEKHHTGQHAERSFSEQRVIEPRHAEPRPVNHYHAEYRTEQRPAESNHVRQHAERRPAEQLPNKQHVTEQRPLEPRQIEPHAVRPIAARVVHEVPGQGQPLPTATSSDKVSELASHISTATPSRQEGKRKAAEIPTTEQATVVPSSKRPRTRDRSTDEDLTNKVPMVQSPRSLRQSSGVGKEPRASIVKRSITFQEVYQDGKAQYKHKIFSWPKDSDNWYIVRCDEHQVHFNNGNPIHGAAKHVHSPQHGHLEKRHDLAMEICGHLVVGCNAELADLNNREFERALKEDKYQVFNMNLLTKEGRRRLTDGPAHKADAVGSPQSTNTPIKKVVKSPTKAGSIITKPEECKFYLGFWAPTKKWYMLIVLPIRPDGSLREVGLREKLQQTDLMSNVPKCYRSDRISLRIIGWQPAYSDGGAKADKREYPVMFFDSPRQKHSVGWLPATKLRPVDLFNPPDDADKKGLAMARDWYAIRMMHRKDWEQFKRLGPGEPPSPSPSEGDAGKSEHFTSLRSAHVDDMSPIRDKSNGPGHFFGSGSSDEGSDSGDTDDPMTMDVGPIPEPADSNYVGEDSGTEASDVDMEMEDAGRNDASRSDVNDALRPGVRNESRRPSSRRGVHSQEVSLDKMKNGETATAASKMDGATQSNSATAPVESEGQNQAIAIAKPEHYMESAQAKAAAAVKEAATRSRASSENSELAKSSSASPIQQHQARPSAPSAQPTMASRTALADPSYTSSEDTLSRVNSSNRNGTMKEARNDLEPQSPQKVQKSVQAESRTEEHVDPYKRFEAIRAQMIGLSSRPASVPVDVGTGTNSPFGPPPQPAQTKELVKRVIQQLPTDSHIMSPPLSQSSAMIPARSSSTTPTNGLESGRNTPKIVIPEDTSRWKMIHNGSSDSMPQSEATLASKSASPTTPSQQSPQQPLVQPTPQLGTPIHDKQETFDVSQFHGPEGVRWTREGPNKPFLRLTTDAMRKWAETARDSGLKATIEPSQVQRIETDYPEGDRDKQRVKLRTKDDREIVLLFETNSANGRSQKAALQGRKFVSWVKRINEKVEWRDE